MTLLNLRLDFLLVSVFTGPAVLGVYAVASKFAELRKSRPGVDLRPLPTVRAARSDDRGRAGPEAATESGHPHGRSDRALWIAATVLIPALYGPEFKGAITLAHIILVGLALEGVAAVITAFSTESGDRGSTPGGWRRGSR